MMKEAEHVIEVEKRGISLCRGGLDPGGQRVNQPRDVRADRSVDDGQMGKYRMSRDFRYTMLPSLSCG
jgi:hypothetical protein